MSVLCTICMRDGSKGVKNKCIKKLKSKHLFLYTSEIAKKISFIDHIIISTNSKKYKTICKQYGLDVPFIRSEFLSKDTSPKIPVVRDALKKAEYYYNKTFDIIIDLDVSSPLRSKNDIVNSYNQFNKLNLGILFTVCNSKKNPYFNMVEITKNKVKIIKNNKKYFRRQDAPKVFDANASIYIWKREYLLKYNTLFTNKTGIYEMPEQRSIDIDTMQDLKIVEFLLN